MIIKCGRAVSSSKHDVSLMIKFVIVKKKRRLIPLDLKSQKGFLFVRNSDIPHDHCA